MCMCLCWHSSEECVERWYFIWFHGSMQKAALILAAVAAAARNNREKHMLCATRWRFLSYRYICHQNYTLLLFFFFFECNYILQIFDSLISALMIFWLQMKLRVLFVYWKCFSTMLYAWCWFFWNQWVFLFKKKIKFFYQTSFIFILFSTLFIESIWCSDGFH